MAVNLKRVLKKAWHPSIVIIILLVVLAFTLFYRLGSLFPNLTSSEANSLGQVTGFKAIAQYPLNILYHLPQLGLIRLHLTSPSELRALSVVIGLGFSIIFYFIVRSRSTARIATLSTALFSTSTWFLLISRESTPDILYFSTLLVIASASLLARLQKKRLTAFIILSLAGLLMYIPGMIWFTLFALIWLRRPLQNYLKSVPDWIITLGAFWSTILLVPLIYAFLHHRVGIEAFLGIPSHLPSIVGYLKNLIEVPMNLFIKGPHSPDMWLGRLPLLDVFSSAMFVLGVYVCWKHWELDYSRMLIGSIVFSSLLIALGGPMTLTVILPFIYLIISLGITFLLQQWLTVFPRNPIARGVAVFLLVFAVAISGYYQLTRYFVAWAHSPSNTSINVALK